MKNTEDFDADKFLAENGADLTPSKRELFKKIAALDDRRLAIMSAYIEGLAAKSREI